MGDFDTAQPDAAASNAAASGSGAYEAPMLVEIGSVHELTLGRRVKITGRTDGFVNAQGQNIGQHTDPLAS